MKLCFLIAPLALGLSACAHSDMTADASAGGCRPHAPADHQGVSQLFTPGMSGGNVLDAISGRSTPGGGKLEASTTMTCVRERNDRKPQTYDLRKIGHVQPVPEVTQNIDWNQQAL